MAPAAGEKNWPNALDHAVFFFCGQTKSKNEPRKIKWITMECSIEEHTEGLGSCSIKWKCHRLFDAGNRILATGSRTKIHAEHFKSTQYCRHFIFYYEHTFISMVKLVGCPLLAFIHIKIIQSQCGNESLISTWHLTFSIWTRCYCIIAFFLRTGLLDMIFLQLEQIFQFYWMLFCWDIFPYWHDVDWNSVLVQWQQVIVT